jgi:hypothetical protein
MQNNEKHKSDLTFLGSGSIPCPLENRVKGGKPPIPHESEQPKKLKGLHSPILCFSPLRGRRSLWYQKKSGGDKMCYNALDVWSEAIEVVLGALCDECRAKVEEKLQESYVKLFELPVEEYPICQECMKKAKDIFDRIFEEYCG